MGAGPRSKAFFGSRPSARDSASACAMACARSRTQLSNTTSKSSPTVATARSGTLPISVNLPRPSSASRASAAGTSPTWSCPLLRSFTTSVGDLAAAATDLVSGQRAYLDKTIDQAVSLPQYPQVTGWVLRRQWGERYMGPAYPWMENLETGETLHEGIRDERAACAALVRHYGLWEPLEVWEG